MARRTETIDEEQQAEIRELLRPLESAAHLIAWDLFGEVETAKPGDLHFHIPNRELPYDGQILTHERERFLLFYAFPHIDTEGIDQPALFELVSRLNTAVVVGSFEYSPEKSRALVFRNFRLMAKREREESEVRAVQMLLNTSDYSLQIFEKSWKYFRDFGMSAKEAIWAAGL